MLPFYTFAQNGTKQGFKNNDLTLLNSIDEKSDSIIKLLNNNISNVPQQIPDNPQGCQNDLGKHETKIKNKNDTITLCAKKIDSLNSKIDSLNSKINTLTSQNDTLVKNANFFNETIFKQCLLYPLEGRYDSIFISECKQCLIDMKIKERHTDLYNTYFHFLDEYKGFNKDVKDFLEGQKTELERKNGKLDMIKLKAELKIKRLPYYKYYNKRYQDPWESIPYLDEVIDKFFSLLNSNELNKKNLQELINKLSETKQKTAATTDAVTDTLDKYIDDLISLLHSGKLNKEDLQDLIDKLPKTETATNTTTEAEAEPKTKQDK